MVGHFLHVPCGFLAILDVVVIKDGTTLRSVTLPLPTLVLCYAVYTIFYLTIVHANHAATTHWPYHFMYQLGGSPAQWYAAPAASTTDSSTSCATDQSASQMHLFAARMSCCFRLKFSLKQFCILVVFMLLALAASHIAP